MSEFDRGTERVTLDTQLARLEREIAPPRDLWPAIERRIVHHKRRIWPFALAASITAAAIATWLGSSRLDQRAQPAHGESTAAVAALFEEPQDARFQQARAALEKTFGERLALLDPATRAAVEASLAQIQASRADLRHALAENPENPVLQQLLESTWHEEFDLYQDIVEDTQPTLARN